jgi:D-proline reductase (dithiol) PrdB
MVDVSTLPDVMQQSLNEVDCPVFENKPWVGGGALNERRVAILSSAGLHLRSDQHFVGGDHSYRAIPNYTDPGEIVMSHISVNFDRTAFQQDINVTFPLKHLADMEEEGLIGSVASNHYSFMGATDPRDMEVDARQLAGVLKSDQVDSVVLLPV